MYSVQLSNRNTIPAIGYGVFKIEDPAQARDSVVKAIELGYRHIDTAAIYQNETAVGEAIKRCGVERSDLFVISKLWNDEIIAQNTRSAFKKSLADLQLEYLDLYLLHCPVKNFEQAWLELVALQQEGLIKNIGVSNFHPEHLQRLAKISDVQPVVNQIESHIYFSNQKVIDYCQARGIAVESWYSLGGEGARTLEDPTIAKLAKKYGKTPAQIIINWHLQRGLICLVKSVTPSRMQSNLEAADFELSAEDLALISALDEGHRLGPNPDEFEN